MMYYIINSNVMIMTLKFLLDEEYNKGKVYARKKKERKENSIFVSLFLKNEKKLNNPSVRESILRPAANARACDLVTNDGIVRWRSHSFFFLFYFLIGITKLT